MSLLSPRRPRLYIDIKKFRYHEWTPALRAAGAEHRRIYDCRHTFASWALDGPRPMNLLRLARVMGTSTAEIDRTYADLMPDSDDYVLDLLDDYDTAVAAATPGCPPKE